MYELYDYCHESLSEDVYSVIRSDMEDILLDELHELDLLDAMGFIDKLMYFEEFINEFDYYYSKLKIKTGTNTLICLCILIGLGRNRTIKLLEDLDVNRKKFEEIRDETGLDGSEIRKMNEKILTKYKWKTKARINRYNELAKINWNKIKQRYKAGESPITLAKEYNTSSHLIITQLEEERLFDYNRSTLTKNKIAEEKIQELDDDFIIELIQNNELDSVDLLWRKALNKYPWLLRRQFLSKIDELGLKRTKEEINAIKSIKSKVPENKDYWIKVNGYKAVEEIFGSDEIMTEKYLNGELGSYKKIVDKINKEISFDYTISQRQVEKIIYNSPNYVSRKSAGQTQLYNFIKNTFEELEVIEEYPLSDNKRIDIFIPELKIGFEFNGDYWHSEAMIEYNYGKTAYRFHKERTEEAAELGIKLLYVWEDDWINHYKEIEKLVINKQWDSELLNKYESTVERTFKKSEERQSLSSHIISFLEENEIPYIKDENLNTIVIDDLFMSINTNTRFNADN